MTINRILRRPFCSLSRTASEISCSPSNHPNNDTEHYLNLLSSCRDFRSLLQLHAHFITSGFNFDTSTTTHLINSYSSFQKPDSARSLFDFTPNPSVIIWNSMIRAYTRSNLFEEALGTYHSMMENSIQPDKYTFTFALKACTGMLDLEEGVLIHQEIVNRKLESDVFIGTGLIDMYCKMGDLNSARKVFDEMPKKDVVAFNAMIAGLSQSSEPLQALAFFRNMQMGNNMEPNTVSLLNLFPAVCKLEDINLCKSIHGYVLRRDFQSTISNGLIDMYSKCGFVETGRSIFDKMKGLNDVSWGTMMAGYVHNGCFHDVLELFHRMKKQNWKINEVSVISALLAASEIGDLETGIMIHECAIREKIASDIRISTTIITMYAKCGELEKAKGLFGRIKGKDTISWSAIISAFSQSGYPEEAINLFREMQNVNFKPNGITLVSVLSSFAESRYLKLGKSIHCYAIKSDIDTHVSTGTALVSMYAKTENFSYALKIFNSMPIKDIVTWNVLINGYVQNFDSEEGIAIFCRLRLFGAHPDSGTMVGVISACSLLFDLARGSSIHGQIVKHGFGLNNHVRNALIDMYLKCGSVSVSEFLFSDSDFANDEVSYNVMIAGYVQNGRPKEALSCFRKMRLELDNLEPNLVTFVSVVPAAAQSAELKEGMSIHCHIIRVGMDFKTPIRNSLVDMYAKCGRIDFSESVFYDTETKDIVSWNAMLGAYAVHGSGYSSLDFFSYMLENHIEVDSVSFLSVLSGCRHAGLVNEGRRIFDSMSVKYGVEPDLKHYACLVDMFGRAGLFVEILNLIQKMPMEADAGVWGALLAGARMHSNVKFAELAVKNLARVEPWNAAHYVVLSGLYSESGEWDCAGETRLKMGKIGLRKIPGCSWIEQKRSWDRLEDWAQLDS